MNQDNKYLQMVQELRFALVAVTVALFVLIGTAFVSSSGKNTATRASAEVVSLQNKIDQLKLENNTLLTKVRMQVTGIDPERIEIDDKLVEDVFKVFEWDSYDSYVGLRNSLIIEYTLDEKSSFLNLLVPVVDEKDFEKGDHTIAIKNLKSHVIGLTPATEAYDYFTTLDLDFTVGGKVKKTQQYAFKYTVSKNKTISNMNLYLIK